MTKNELVKKFRELVLMNLVGEDEIKSIKKIGRDVLKIKTPELFRGVPVYFIYKSKTDWSFGPRIYRKPPGTVIVKKPKYLRHDEGIEYELDPDTHEVIAAYDAKTKMEITEWRDDLDPEVAMKLDISLPCYCQQEKEVNEDAVVDQNNNDAIDTNNDIS